MRTDLGLTVFGCSGTHPKAGVACSSYLVEADGHRLLLDCGNGSLVNLQQRIDVAALDGLLLSHLHPDHFADIYGLYYALRFHRDGPRSLPVYAPAGAEAHIGQLLDSYDELSKICGFRTVAAGDRLESGPLSLELFPGDHPVESLAVRITAGDRTLAYSGDSGPTPGLVDCARGADLFLADCTWLERDGPHPASLHMTGAQAGKVAAEAGVRSLLVTHVFPANDPLEVAAEAARVFGGDVRVARILEDHRL